MGRLRICNRHYPASGCTWGITVGNACTQVDLNIKVLCNIHIYIRTKIITLKYSLCAIIRHVRMFVVTVLLIIICHYIVTGTFGATSDRQTIILLNTWFESIIKIIPIISFPIFEIFDNICRE